MIASAESTAASSEEPIRPAWQSAHVSIADLMITVAHELVDIWPKLASLQMSYSAGEVPDYEEIHDALGQVMRFCNSLGWKDLSRQSVRLVERFAANERVEVLQALIADLREGFESKIRDVRILVVEDKYSGLLANATVSLCGKSLHPDLAVSEEEFNTAGKALALEMSTACVSHAMRSAEASLHVLCHVLRIVFPGSIELQDWKTLEEKIQSEIKSQEQQPRSQRKAEQLKTLAGLMLPAQGFRLAWRNHVAHAREGYNESAALGILRHVADFLRTLSAAIW
jgi:hypothetical protein